MLLGAVCILTETQFVYAGTQTFEGDYQIESHNTVPQVIPFTVAQDSVVYLNFLSECSTQDNSGISFHTSWGSSLIRTNYPYYPSHYRRATDIEQPYGPFPLKSGEYQVTLTCGGETISEGTAVGYSLTVTTTPANARYTSDPEPDWTESDAMDLHATQSFEGSLGYGGYPSGGDENDKYYFNLQEGTKYQVKIEYDDTFTDTYGFDRQKDLQLQVDNNGVFLHYQATGSGFITPEYTVGPNWGCPGTWSCPLRIWVNANIYSSGSIEPYFPALGYGGYKLTVIINGTEGPNAELGLIKKITSEYWDDDSHRWVTVEALVAGEESTVDINIANRGSSSLAVKLVHGLSVKGGPVKIVGGRLLTLPADNSFHTYHTTLTTPANTPVSVTGDLVTVLYDKDNQILDTSTMRVNMWGPNHLAPMAFLGILLLGGGGL